MQESLKQKNLKNSFEFEIVKSTTNFFDTEEQIFEIEDSKTPLENLDQKTPNFSHQFFTNEKNTNDFQGDEIFLDFEDDQVFYYLPPNTVFNLKE